MESIDNQSVLKVIEERISPLLAVDGGKIELISINDEKGGVTVRFGGTYRGSPCRLIVLNWVVKPILNETLNMTINVDMAD